VFAARRQVIAHRHGERAAAARTRHVRAVNDGEATESLPLPPCCPPSRLCHDLSASRTESDRIAGMRYYSVPEKLAMAGVGAAAVAPVYPWVARMVGTGLKCPLRTMTGVPCPMCGMTTATIALVRGDPAAAATANPLVFGLVAVTVVGGAFLALRALGILGEPTMWSPTARRRCGQAVAVLASVSWLYQMRRFGLV
jgi:hypothetical protein